MFSAKGLPAYSTLRLSLKPSYWKGKPQCWDRRDAPSPGKNMSVGELRILQRVVIVASKFKALRSIAVRTHTPARSRCHAQAG